MAGLPAKAPNTILVPTSADPGLVAGDEDESTLDVLRVLTTAPGTQADLVIAAGASGGVSTAIQYEINTLRDPILSISYGSCETTSSASSVQFYDTLFSQGRRRRHLHLRLRRRLGRRGMRQGLLRPHRNRGPSPWATISAPAPTSPASEAPSSPTRASTPSTGPPPTPPPTSTALGYIPEGAWNEPTLTSSTGAVTYQIAGTGSGPSAFIPKPTWQTGTGVPGRRCPRHPRHRLHLRQPRRLLRLPRLPRLQRGLLQGAAGHLLRHLRHRSRHGRHRRPAQSQRLGVSQGNLNPVLYRLASTTPAAFHDATPASSGVATCTTATATLCNNSVASKTSITGGVAGYPLQTGYDLATGLGSLDVTNFLNAAVLPVAASTVTLTAPTTTVAAGQALALTATVAAGSFTSTPTGNIKFSASGAFPNTSIPLSGGKATDNATLSTPGSYSVTATYSGDANFQSGASSPLAIVVTAAPTTLTVTSSPTFLATGASAVFTAKVATALTSTPTGTVQFYSNAIPIGTPVTLANATATSASTPFPTKGTYAITATYSGDANNQTSTSNAFSLVVATPGATVTTLSAPSPTVTPGAATPLSAKIVGNSSQTPTGTVQFFANSVSLAPAASLVNGSTSITYDLTTPGSYNLTANYSGDSLNAPSVSSPASVTVAKYSTSAALTATATAFSTAQTTIVTLTLPQAAASAPAPGGSIQLFANGASLGSPILLSNQSATSPALSFPATGAYALTATYSGDSSYNAATLTGPTLTVTLPTIAVAPSPATISLTSGASTGNTSTLTVSTPNGYAGAVALACAITSAPSSATNPPTCSLAPATLNLTAAAATTVLTLTTTVPHAATPTGNVANSQTPSTTRFPARLPIAMAALCVLLLPLGRRTPRIRSPLALLLLLLLAPAAAITVTGCSASVSSSGSNTTPPTPVLVGTTAGAYTVTITATPTTGAAVSTTLTLTVQ